MVTIDRAPADVYAAVTDVARMGEWSPECVGGRWLPPMMGPQVGARFEGDNVAKIGPLTVKKWTTESEVTASVPGELFEFISADYTRWRYEFIEIGGATRVTESFQYEPYEGFQKFLYDTLLKRQQAMVKGMQQTLDRMKALLEGTG